MSRIALWFVTGAVCMAVLSAPGSASDEYESLSALAEHFHERGLEPLPGRESMLVEGGVVGVFAGSPRGGERKSYVLVVASPPVGAAALRALVDVGRKGVVFNDLSLPPLLAAPGRHVIISYFEDPASHGEGVIPLEQVAASIDLSALAGGSGSSLRVQSAGSSPVWMRLIEQSNIPLGLDIQVQEAPDLGSTRAATFIGRETPVLQLAAAASATPPPGNELRYIAASTFAALLAAKVSRLAEPPAFQRLDESAAGAPRSKRPYTGTIPAYTAEAEGLLLEGVLAGGPAEEAGLQAGDVIVEMAGTAITDVYGYSDVLDSLELDVAVTVVFVRDGERLETTLTPRGRE